MDGRDRELLCGVVEHDGFSAVARVIGDPKSSLGAAVQRLESSLGPRLMRQSSPKAAMFPG
jgi:DNA-binding transcriptional LysR family regulator